MSLSFDRLKNIAIPTKHLIHGYIRRCQTEFFGDRAIQNPYYNIPEQINSYCILFYEVLTWYKKKCGNGIEFVSDTEVKANGVKAWSTCILEKQISNQVCDKFSITFKIVSFGKNSFGEDHGYPTFDIGYTTGNSIEESVQDWNHELGSGPNRETSWAFSFYLQSIYYIGTPNTNYFKSRVSKYILGDVVELEFDFKEKKVNVYQNARAVDGADLNADHFWVGICFVDPGSMLELVKYTYE